MEACITCVFAPHASFWPRDVSAALSAPSRRRPNRDLADPLKHRSRPHASTRHPAGARWRDRVTFTLPLGWLHGCVALGLAGGRPVRSFLLPFPFIRYHGRRGLAARSSRTGATAEHRHETAEPGGAEPRPRAGHGGTAHAPGTAAARAIRTVHRARHENNVNGPARPAATTAHTPVLQHPRHSHTRADPARGG